MTSDSKRFFFQICYKCIAKMDAANRFFSESFTFFKSGRIKHTFSVKIHKTQETYSSIENYRDSLFQTSFFRNKPYLCLSKKQS